jgi:Amt family ammonium transporter
VAGLVAITPCAGFVGGMAPVYIGLATGAICYLALGIKRAFKLDDSLDVIAVHLIGGLAGTLMLGLFADSVINPAVVDEGLFLGGGAGLLWDQFVAALVTIAYSFAVTFIIGIALDKTMGLRITPAQEEEGMDLALHAEEAYAS